MEKAGTVLQSILWLSLHRLVKADEQLRGKQFTVNPKLDLDGHGAPKTKLHRPTGARK